MNLGLSVLDAMVPLIDPPRRRGRPRKAPLPKPAKTVRRLRAERGVWPTDGPYRVDGRWDIAALRLALESGKLLSDIGAEAGVSRERIRQIVEKAGIPGSTGVKRAKVLRRVKAVDAIDDRAVRELIDGFRERGLEVRARRCVVAGRSPLLDVAVNAHTVPFRVHWPSLTNCGNPRYLYRHTSCRMRNALHFLWVPERGGWHIVPPERVPCSPVIPIADEEEIHRGLRRHVFYPRLSDVSNDDLRALLAQVSRPRRA